MACAICGAILNPFDPVYPNINFIDDSCDRGVLCEDCYKNRERIFEAEYTCTGCGIILLPRNGLPDADLIMLPSGRRVCIRCYENILKKQGGYNTNLPWNPDPFYVNSKPESITFKSNTYSEGGDQNGTEGPIETGAT